ncbi:MAG: MotA/TolQ/ExbB proton channel family protein [Verrucomicrobiae bacterium]|nr:MotA/TolQ/ExbB proton channel family protein [Verrucomicrobiae bacterium]
MELIFLGLLLLTSLVGGTVIVERGLALRRSRVVPAEVVAALQNCHGPQDLGMLLKICQQKPSSLSRLVQVAAQHLEWPKDENAEAVQTQARQEIVGLERGLVILEITVGIAPLLGLVGTVFGLMSLFGTLGSSEIIQSTELAKGISVILTATLLGLLIAIPALIAWSYYNAKIQAMAVEMESLCTEFLRRQYLRRGPG